MEVDVGLLLEGVRGDLYLDGARPAGGHLAEGLVYGVRQVRGFEDALGPLCDGSDCVDLVVDLVEGAEVLSDMFPVDLAGYEEHGGRGGVCGADAGGGVEQAGAGHYEGCAEAAAGPGVAVGHVGGALLVAVGDEADAGLVVECVHGMV